MLTTSVRAKPNSQIAEWSPKVWLVHSLPTEGSVPGGTPKFHLFRKLSRDQKQIEQSPEELEKKLQALKSTVKEVSKYKQFDEEDQKWWDNFWACREQTRDRLGEGDVVDCTPDEQCKKFVNDLLWPRRQESQHQPAAVSNPTQQVDQVEEPTVPTPEHALDDLRRVLTPETSPATAVDFGRNRKTGYVTVGPGEEKTERFKAVKASRKVVKEDVLLKTFKDHQLIRGATESKFVVEKVKVGALLILDCTLSRDGASISLPKALMNAATLRLGCDENNESDNSDDDDDQEALLEEEEVFDEGDKEEEEQVLPPGAENFDWGESDGSDDEDIPDEAAETNIADNSPVRTLLLNKLSCSLQNLS